MTTTDADCRIDKTVVSDGKKTFTVRNEGSRVADVFLGAGHVTSLNPRTSRKLEVTLTPGTTKLTCIPFGGSRIERSLRVKK